MQLAEAIPEEEDYDKLNRLLDHVKRDIFLSKNSKGEVKKEFATFFGSLMSGLVYIWDSKIKTAATNGINMFWNPKFFLLLPHGTRLTVFMHELWHVARLDVIYHYGKDPKRWNAACDIWINNTLDDQGYSFEGIPFKFWLDHTYDGWTAEDIYDDLKKKDDAAWEKFCKDHGIDPNDPDWWKDLLEPSQEEDIDAGNVSEEQLKVIAIVQTAAQAAKMASENCPGAVESMIKQFLTPKIPWEKELINMMDALIEEDYSWNVRDRRITDIYLPWFEESEGLEDLFYGVDVSGSMSDPMVIRCTSEVKYIKERFRPKKTTLFQFDEIVQRIDEWTDEEEFNEVMVQGRGGTSLHLVADYLEKHKPRAAIIFSDLYCDKMRVVPGVEVIWVVLNNPHATVNQGRMIHIRE
ncbi:putative metallopeptidase domain-containing protein [Rhizobium phage RHph_I1_6]|uniref:Putative metallopeptidase domain-containing protein n=1 Tax=Rhizobium phage RHph_I1_6 TaxID=2509728 RepID=A0A7S5V2A2_9CAUD|nr:HNH endonuclease [Rhizobium phage RHph_I1_6]QIG76568.1 putative metallopeptidase domain-containing protein [Rhizobium phage RHph_I1_6]